ncbi:MAG: SRPBCC domain-containing protein [Nanoarchaeota archaeon]|nr:SRPBCC domain-containing protein [Nanoarchaeota archaeon]
MAKIYHKFTIETPASAVYPLLTTVEGLQKWWMKDSRGTPEEVNGEIEFGDKSTYYNKMKVISHEKDKKVVWQVLESVGPMPEAEAWNKTTIEIELEEKQLARLGGKTATIVLFKHSGFPQGSEDTKPFAEANFYWAYSLLGLKNVAEGKEGFPM